MHVECPKDFKFCLPVSWVTTLTMQDTTRDVISSRYDNTTIVGQDHYMVCWEDLRSGGHPSTQKTTFFSERFFSGGRKRNRG